ncbi:leucine-rich repeat flightless-interacting protein 2 isoform X8 [Hoplias malabaricus]|uniref:leucine-rich repeat flightless-interacting protein 2 isoform X8 n=1 Tax=Hoplias malabaricus TaxID=27720 RepID=UPI003462F04B
MGSQGPGRKRTPNRNGLTAEEDALNIIAREAETRLAAKRAARAEAREIRMRELERQQKEIYQVQKKYYGFDSLNNKWGNIEQWMEDSERCTHQSQRPLSEMSDDEERTTVESRGNIQDNSSNTAASFLGDAASSSCLSRDLQYVTIPDLPNSSRRLLQGSSQASTTSAATLISLGETSLYRGSGDPSATTDTQASIEDIKEIHELKDQIQDVEAKYMQRLKDIQDLLSEMEEKYRKAMVSNSHLDNEKSTLMYQVDTLKENLTEMEELLSETRRELEENVKDLEREKLAHSVLQFKFDELEKTVKQSEELHTEIHQLRLREAGFLREVSDLKETIEWKNKKIGALERQKDYSDAIRNERDELRDDVVQLRDIVKKHGIVLGPDLSTRREVEDVTDRSPCTEQGNSVLEIRLRKLVDEREILIEQVKKLKGQLDNKNRQHDTEDSSKPDQRFIDNGTDPVVMDLQRDTNRQISDLKYKLAKSEQEVTALEQNVTRLESLVTRYKSAAESAEKEEDELKAEKRKLQRELRSALDKIEELEGSNCHLIKRLEKMKANLHS